MEDIHRTAEEDARHGANAADRARRIQKLVNMCRVNVSVSASVSVSVGSWRCSALRCASRLVSSLASSGRAGGHRARR